MWRRARVLHTVSLTVAVMLVVIAASNILIDPEPGYRIVVSVLLLVTIAMTQWLLRRGRLRPAGWLLTTVLWATMAVTTLVSGGVASPTSATLVSVTIIAGLVLGGRAALGFTILSIGVLFVAYMLERSAALPASWMTYGPFSAWTTISGSLVFCAVFLVLGLSQLETALEQERAASRALRASKRKFSALVRESPLGIVSMCESGRLLSFNPAAERISGYAAADVIGKRLADAFRLPQAAIESLQAQVAAAAAGELPVVVEHHFECPDGPRVIEITARCYRGERGSTTLEATLHDATERVRQLERSRMLESRLRQAQRLESVGLLAGGIAHDFNNLLTVVLANIELVRSGLPVDSELLEHIEDIQLAVGRASSLTRHLLAFSRRQRLKPQVTDLDELLTQTNKLLRRVIGENIEIRFSPGDVADCVYVDPGQIEQVILNLALNARDAMPAGGRLELATASVELSDADAGALGLAVGGRYVTLKVCDTGTGIDQDTLAHVFDPFFTTKEPGKGTGLGLSTALGIMQQSGGAISVDSEPGRGTCFTIYLPPSPCGEPELALGSGEAATGSETILLAEDDAAVRRVVANILRAAGYRVLEAQNGAQAVEIALAQAEPIDLLVTDAVMPEINGRELAARLTARCPDLPFLVISGYADEAMDLDALPSRNRLEKPFTRERLTARVRELLDDATKSR